MPKLKRRLTEKEEFEIMKMVLDKFLWLGFIILGIGFYQALTRSLTSGLWFMIAGALMLVVFAVFVIREFEFIR